MELIRIDRTLLANIGGKSYNKTCASTLEAISAEKEILEAGEKKALEFFELPKTGKQLQIEEEYNKELARAEEIEDILDFMKHVRDNGHELFEVKENSIYLKGINISMPELLVKEIAQVHQNLNNSIIEGDVASEYEYEKQQDSLVNFWNLCAMNPDPRARHDLFNFLKGGKFAITTQGFFVAYRNARIKNSNNKDLVDFVTKTWLHTKTVTKKSPHDYYVVLTDGEYSRVNINSYTGDKENIIGVLGEVYENLDQYSEVTYTDNHTRTMTIKIGEPVHISRKACDANPESDCSNGLHIGNKNFLSRGSFGNEGLVVLVNPRNTVAVPHYNQNKMRVCEYLPIAVAEYDDNGSLMEIDSAILDYDLGEDVLEELQDVSDMSKTEFEEYKLNYFISPELTLESLMNIKDNVSMSIEEANEIVKSRTL